MSEHEPTPEPVEGASEPKVFSTLDLPQQVHALCLAAREEVSVDMITEWLTHSRGELAPEQLKTVQDTYNSLHDSIKWGDDTNNQLIETLFGASSATVHGAIADSIMSKILPDGLE